MCYNRSMIVDLLLAAFACLGFFSLRAPLPLEGESAAYARAGFAMLELLVVFATLVRASRRLQITVFERAYQRNRDNRRANRAYFTLMRLGVIVHELAHALFATLLGGRVTDFSVFSDYRTGGRASRRGAASDQPLGHVIFELPVGPSFRLRRSLTGVAPLPVGLAVIAGLLWLGGLNYGLLQGDPLAAIPWADWRWYAVLLVIIPIANMMLPSSEDLAGWPLSALFVAGLLALVVLLAPAFRLDLSPLLLGLPTAVGLLSLVLAIPIASNLIFSLLLRLLL